MTMIKVLFVLLCVVALAAIFPSLLFTVFVAIYTNFPTAWPRLCYKHIGTKVTDMVGKVLSREKGARLWAFLHTMTMLSTSDLDWRAFEALVREVMGMLKPNVPADLLASRHELADVDRLILALRRKILLFRTHCGDC
jgi:hypothetical protein